VRAGCAERSSLAIRTATSASSRRRGVGYFTEGASGEIKRKTLDRKSPFFAAGEDIVNSFVQVNENEMKVETISADGKPIDSYTIKRNGQ
jgi:hypothetical protein